VTLDEPRRVQPACPPCEELERGEGKGLKLGTSHCLGVSPLHARHYSLSCEQTLLLVKAIARLPLGGISGKEKEREREHLLRTIVTARIECTVVH